MTEQVLFSLPLERLEPIFKSWVRDVLSQDKHEKTEPIEEVFLTVDETAEFLKVKRATVYGYIYNRAITNFKRRGKIYFKKSDLVKWRAEGRRMTRDEIALAAAESLKQ